MAKLAWPPRGVAINGLLAAGLDHHHAAKAARALARFDDPEREDAGHDLPPRASLFGILGAGRVDARRIAEAWGRAGRDPRPVATIGVSADGPFTVDLAEDGPHALVAGTTGSGKSELLRTLIAALALDSPPDQLSFVLIDFKGGAAFDCCARLPHVVGVLTDLDERLVARAMRCLEAELRRRERLLRAAGAADLAAYRAVPRGESLARLVIVVDEFASLAADHPDVLEGLVRVAQQGRSMGMHLVLATQRPSGSVNDHIRANMNLRIALRVQDPSDSIDVVDVPGAVTIDRRCPGRALVRLGPTEVVAVQTAFTAQPVPAVSGRAVTLAACGPGRGRVHAALHRSPAERPGPLSTSGSSELEQLVGAACSAATIRDAPAPHRPWPDPLPTCLDLAEISTPPQSPGGPLPGVHFALADDPDGQCHRPSGWQPPEGNLLLVGLPGSGTTTALAAIAHALARATSPANCHVYVVDLGTGELGSLAELPHVGAVIRSGETERQRRLLRMLAAELSERRAGGTSAEAPSLVVLIDGVGPLLAAWNDPLEPLADVVGQLVAEGPACGIHLALAADRPSAVPLPWLSAIRQRLVFSLAEPSDYAMVGLTVRAVPALPPGRAIRVDSGATVQVGWPGEIKPSRGVVPPGEPRRAKAIGILPRAVPYQQVAAVATFDTPAWTLPVGLGDHDLAPVSLRLQAGEHALIAGPRRSGRSNVLAVMAAAACVSQRPHLRVAAICEGRSPLSSADGVNDVIDPCEPERLVALASSAEQLLVLIDDVEAVDDHHGALTELLSGRHEGLRVVGAGRSEALRGAYGHWSRLLRSAGVGVLLRPCPDLDGELLGVMLPRRNPAPAGPGRGWLVEHGAMEFIQAAHVIA